MKRGLIKVSIFYAVGIALTVLVLFVFGAARGHAPGPWFFVAASVLIVGIFWLVIALYSYFFKGKLAEQGGAIVAHTIVAMIVAVAIWMPRYEDGPLNSGPVGIGLEVMKRNDSILIASDGKTLYLKVGDSVQVDDLDPSLKDIYQIE